MRAWHDWYHVNGSTYGTWLPGDPRGYRTRHHREHIEGDYRNPPPPGRYDAVLARSQELMRRDAVWLSPEAQRVACDEIASDLVSRLIVVLAVAVDSHHYHVLARFPDHRPRHWIGLAKKRSAAELSRRGLAAPGGVWSVRCKVSPIADRSHQINAFRYILDHASRGAATWTFRRGNNDHPNAQGS